MRPRFLDFGKFAKINGFVGRFFGADFQKKKHFRDFGHKSRKHVKRGSMPGHIFGGTLNFSVQDFGDERARAEKNRGRARNPIILGASRLREGDQSPQVVAGRVAVLAVVGEAPP